MKERMVADLVKQFEIETAGDVILASTDTEVLERVGKLDEEAARAWSHLVAASLRGGPGWDHCGGRPAALLATHLVDDSASISAPSL